MVMPAPSHSEGPTVNPNPNHDLNGAADGDLDTRDAAANRQEMGFPASASTEGPKPSTDPMTDPERAAGGGAAVCELLSESQHPAQEGWDLEYEWLQEVERENDEGGPWADFV